MYVETGMCEEDQVPLVVPSSGPRRWVSWVGAAVVMVVVYSGVHFSTFSLMNFGSSGVVGESEVAQLQIPLYLTYLDLCDTHKARKADALSAIQKALKDKAGLDTKLTSIDETTLTCTKDKASDMVVKVNVPPEISAAALASRLKDHRKSSLTTMIETNLNGVAAIQTLITPKLVQVQAGAMTSTTTKTKRSVTTGSSRAPPLTVDLTIRNLDYDKLKVATGTLKTSFASAVQKGIAPTGVEAQSIALDISNSVTVPSAVHIVARIPAPAGSTLDQMMTKWVGGPLVVQNNVQAIADIALILTTGSTNVKDIKVFSTGPHFGAVRSSYERRVTAEFYIYDLLTTSTDYQGPDKDKSKEADNNPLFITDFKKKVDAVLAGKGVAQGSVVWSVKAHGKTDAAGVTTPVHLTATVSATDSTKNTTKIEADWSSKMSLAGLLAQKQIVEEDKSRTGAAKWLTPTFRVSSVAGTVKTEWAYVELLMTVHGVNYANIVSGTESFFQTEIAKAVRSGVHHYDDKFAASADQLLTETSVANSQVAISAGSAANTLDVTIKIPTNDIGTPKLAGKLVNLLETQIAEKKKTDLKTSLETELRKIAGVQYISTWLKDSITVTFPGQAV